MQPLYDFTAFMANRLSRRLARIIKPTEIVINAIYPRADILGTLTKEMVVDVIYNGQHYKTCYDRMELFTLFDTALDTVVGKIPAELSTSDSIVAYVANKLKIDMTGISCVNPTNPNVLQLDATNHPLFKGKLALPKVGGIGTIPTHFWQLDGNFEDIGRYSVTMANNFDFVTEADKQWAAIKSGTSWGDTGILLPNNVDFTIQFEILATSLAGLSTILTEAVYTTVTYNYNCIYTKWISGEQRFGLYNRANTPLPSEVPAIIAVSRAGNVWKVFLNGIQIATTTNNNGNKGYRWFGSYGTRRNKFYIRNYAYWTQALSDTEIAANALIK